MKYAIAIILLLFTSISVFATDSARKVIVIQKQVEFDSNYYLGQNGYYSTQNVLLQKYLDENQAQKQKIQKLENAAFEAKLDEIIALLKKCQTNGTPLPTPEPTPEPTPTPEPNPTPSPTEPTALDTEVFKIFSESCASCHNETAKKGGLVLVGQDNEGKYLSNIPSMADRLNIHFRVRGVGLTELGLKRMPLGGAPLSDNDVETLYKWAREGQCK